MTRQSPRLRNVDKIKPPYPLGKFPKTAINKIGADIVYHLATSPTPNIEGPIWERIFARSIGAEWKPSNVGLDDIVLGVCAWGAKTVKNSKPHKAKTVRLISGRNSPAYSFGKKDLSSNAQEIGTQVLEIWNGRVEAVREKFSHLRKVILIKSLDLAEFTLFETETLFYMPERFEWRTNVKDNLEGWETSSSTHKFTWQFHGSQFTIFENVPDTKTCFRLKRPNLMDYQRVLDEIGFDPSWIEIVTPE